MKLITIIAIILSLQVSEQDTRNKYIKTLHFKQNHTIYPSQPQDSTNIHIN